MKGKSSISVNGVEWTENQTRKELACASCAKPTRGRIGRKPMCIDCGMAEMMKTVRVFKEYLRGLFR